MLRVPRAISSRFGTGLLETLLEDARTAYERDPGAGHPLEVLLYPGVHAVWAYRLASRLQPGHPVLPRLCSQLARLFTGVDLHPASDIGRGVFVDHAVGEGATVGSGAVVDDDVPPGATVVGVPAERVRGRSAGDPTE